MKFIQYFLKKTGFKIIRMISIIPNHMHVEDQLCPLSLSYVLNSNGTVVKVELEKGRGLPCFSFGKNSNHPYVLAAKYAGLSEEKIFFILKNYYKLVNASSALDVFGIFNSISIANNYPYWAVVMPWDSESQQEWSDKIKQSVLIENMQMGKKMSVDKGWSWIGPTSDEKVRIESKRLLHVLKSIKASGYRRNDDVDGDIVVNILVKNQNDWIWQSITGQHRASVLSSLDYNTVPVRVMKVIRRDDVIYWPNVLNGLYSVDEALHIFDSVFDDEFSYLTKNWDEFIKNNIGGE